MRSVPVGKLRAPAGLRSAAETRLRSCVAAFDRIVVVGAGAIGAGIGGLLWDSGTDVLLVARGANGEALARDGLDLRLPGGPRRLRVPVGRAEEVGRGDLVLLATMGHDSVRALAAVPAEVPIASFQNGLQPLEDLAHRPLIAAMLYVPAERREPGVVALAGTPSPGAIFLGKWPNGVLGPEPALSAALCRAGFRAEVFDEIAPWIRAKVLTNLGGIHHALCDAPEMDVIHWAVDEARACFAADGAEVVPDDDFDARIGPMQVTAVDGLPRIGGSTRHALARGDRLETEWLHDWIVRCGRRVGVPTPQNAALIALAEQAMRERWRVGALSARELRETLAPHRAVPDQR